MKRRSFLAAGAASLASAVLPQGASAQAYPDKPIRIIVPWPPGAVDVYIRVVQAFAEKQLGKPLIVENRGGANGAIGTEFVKTSKPDGYTLLFNVTSSAVMAPLTTETAKFDIRKDFSPITDFFVSPLMLVVRKDFPANTLQELIDYGRKNQGKLNFGSPGAGSALHVNSEAFAKAIGVQMTHVPYKGFAPEVQALMAGELDMGLIATGTIRSQVLSGAVKAIGATGGAVGPELPQVPDLVKAVPGFDPIPIFAALWAPAGTPKDIVAQLNKVMTDALKQPDIRAKIGEGGQIPLGRSVAETAKAVEANVEVATRLVLQAKAAGVKFD
jgi:tripartite-type tricarboxylate transporter receptor subunit TctC